MKRFSMLTPMLMILLFLSACGARAAQPTPPPTVNVLDMQSTMAAAALTMVAQTQAAIPTSTPPPTATNTPVPASTLPPVPSSAVTLTAAPTGNPGSGDDPCVNQELPATLHGETIRMRINNSTKETMRVSVYLNRNEPQGQCGYRAFNLDPGQSVTFNDLVEGCYTLFAWNIDPEEYFIVNNGTSCVDNSATWVFDISNRDIRLRT